MPDFSITVLPDLPCLFIRPKFKAETDFLGTAQVLPKKQNYMIA